VRRQSTYDPRIRTFHSPRGRAKHKDVREQCSPDPEPAAEDAVPPLDPGSALTRRGDLWLLGRHRLLRGDSREAATLHHLLGDERADLVRSKN
jgi:hypothetical protein